MAKNRTRSKRTQDVSIDGSFLQEMEGAPAMSEEKR